MLTDREVTVMLPATDLARAQAWYEEKLGLKPQKTEEYGSTYILNGGTPMFLYETEFAGTAKHTLLSIATDDLEADMKSLRGRGVTFVDYDTPGLKTTNGIAEFGPVKNAWFTDPDGNIIGLVQGM